MGNDLAFFVMKNTYLETSYPDGMTKIIHFLLIYFPSESKRTDLLVLSFPIVIFYFYFEKFVFKPVIKNLFYSSQKNLEKINKIDKISIKFKFENLILIMLNLWQTLLNLFKYL